MPYKLCIHERDWIPDMEISSEFFRHVDLPIVQHSIFHFSSNFEVDQRSKTNHYRDVPEISSIKVVHVGAKSCTITGRDSKAIAHNYDPLQRHRRLRQLATWGAQLHETQHKHRVERRMFLGKAQIGNATSEHITTTGHWNDAKKPNYRLAMLWFILFIIFILNPQHISLSF